MMETLVHYFPDVCSFSYCLFVIFKDEDSGRLKRHLAIHMQILIRFTFLYASFIWMKMVDNA